MVRRVHVRAFVNGLRVAVVVVGVALGGVAAWGIVVAAAIAGVSGHGPAVITGSLAI